MGDISQWIKEYQETKDEKLLWNIIQKFEPAIRKSIYHVKEDLRDDMRQELMIAVWRAVETLKDCSSEGGCIKYISSAIHHQAKRVSYNAIKHEEHETTVDMFWDETLRTGTSEYSMIEFQIDFREKTRNMNDIQKKMAEYAFLRGINDTEIAEKLKKSRQYVNREKKKIAKKLLE